jgi:hypothetical protein
MFLIFFIKFGELRGREKRQKGVAEKENVQ